MSDSEEDRAIAERLAEELASDLNDSRDPLYAPWGGLFRKEEVDVFPTSVGSA